MLAALGTGLFLWLMAPASRHGVPWASIIAVTALVGSTALALYAFATLHGQLVIVSVLGSLYPVVTVLLAYRVLGERVHGAQQLGIAAVLLGVALLSA